jgi:hypothetical protein
MISKEVLILVLLVTVGIKYKAEKYFELEERGYKKYRETTLIK